LDALEVSYISKNNFKVNYPFNFKDEVDSDLVSSDTLVLMQFGLINYSGKNTYTGPVISCIGSLMLM